MNFNLSDEQREFRKMARSFARTEMAPNAATWDDEERFPTEVMERAGALGLMGMYAPGEQHGAGLCRLDAAIILEELAAGCTSTAAFISIHNMAFNMIARYGSAEIRDKWCADLAAGRRLASYCLTEPGSGSDAASLQTSARRDGDDYLINGAKAFISGGGASGVLVVMARTGGEGPSGISAFAVAGDAKGLSYGKKERKLGWRSQPTCTISFDNVRVPASAMLDREGRGFALAMAGLDGGRINIGACSVGTARFCIEQTLAYTGERKQFGKRICDFQNSQFVLADMLTELTAARQMVYLAASKLDSGDAEARTYCAMAKRLATDLGFEICNRALQMHGGYGYMSEYPLERCLRDVRVHQILEGTNEIMRLIIGRRMVDAGSLDHLQ